MKAGRQKKILEIIDSFPVENQDELGAQLRAIGYKVTQATISRDIKEMGLVKVSRGEHFCYSLPTERNTSRAEVRLRHMFQDAVQRVDHADNLIVIRTLPGTAHAVASAIDQVEINGILGTVAGDDTILVVAKTRALVNGIITFFKGLLE